METWPVFHEPALSWLARVERVIRRRAGEQTGALLAIINAIEYQLEAGAHVPTLASLLTALRTLAQADGLDLKFVHLEADAPTLIQRLEPSTDTPR
jgi:hypothetical protein